MAMDLAPWMIGGGAEHSVETARLLPYVSNGGREGVAEPGDFKVTPLPTPGGGVQYAPGGAYIRNTNPGGAQQTYVGRNGSADTVDVQPTGSSGGRADMVAIVVRDPQYPGTSVPSDPVTARYVDVEVIQGVPSNARTAADAGLTFPAYPLARINLPANTGTVQASHITDLRNMVSPQRDRTKLSEVMGSRVEVERTGTYRTLREFQVEVPDFATAAIVDVALGGAYIKSGNGSGSFSFAGLNSSSQSEPTPWDIVDSSDEFHRIPYIQAGRRVRVNPEHRGTVQTIYLTARVDASSDQTVIFGADYWARAFLDIEWLQEIE